MARAGVLSILLLVPGVCMAQHHAGGSAPAVHVAPSPSFHGAHSGFNHPIQTGPGLNLNYSQHKPFVGDQNWTPAFGDHGRRHFRGFVAIPYAVPYYDWSGYDSDYYSEPPSATVAPQYQEQAPSQDYYEAPPESGYTSPGATVPETPDPQPPIVIVFHNGQTVQVSSYAIAQGFIWDFSKQIAHKIPVSSIDVDASSKATEQAGGEFPAL